MEWDARVWMIFMWLISSIMFICAFSTPYFLPGNRVDTLVAYGGNVLPQNVEGSLRYGLWGDIPADRSGYMHIVQAAMSGALVFGILVTTAMIVALVRCGERRMIQIMAGVSLGLGAICNLIGVAAFKGSAPDDEQGQAFWMSLSVGVVWGLCSICCFIQPLFVEVLLHGKKQATDDEAGEPLTKKA